MIKKYKLYDESDMKRFLIEEKQTTTINSQLKMGIEIEKEHENTYNKLFEFVKKNKKFPAKNVFFKWIAEDHLKEMKDYYTKLKKMEKENEKSI